jgi:hypothetical protein
VAFGRKGGKARLQKLSPERRKEIARKAIAARWTKAKSKMQAKVKVPKI